MTSTSVACVMHSPPLFTTVRVNLMKLPLEAAKQRLQEMFSDQYQSRSQQCPTVETHPLLKDLLFARGTGPYIDIEPNPKEIYVDSSCGSAVMRGANIYIPGVMGSSTSFNKLENVSVWMDIQDTIRRGLKQTFTGEKVFLGNGLTLKSREEIFASVEKLGSTRGIAVQLQEAVWNQPCVNTIVENWGYCQNLPSIVAVHVLGPQAGETVLDMCAAPGGKSTHIAALMHDSGRVVCLDRGSVRPAKVMKAAAQMELHCLEVHPFYDATRCCDLHAVPGSELAGPPFPPQSFDRVLVDPSCSSLGQRPLLGRPQSEKSARSNQPVQRKLLKTAVHLLKRGGTLVYSTCTLRREENEEQVDWLLDTFSYMQLDSQIPHIGKAPVRLQRPFDAQCVQKFDPGLWCAVHGVHGKDDCLSSNFGYRSESFVTCDHVTSAELDCDKDTIGFFIAKFKKS